MLRLLGFGGDGSGGGLGGSVLWEVFRFGDCERWER